MRGEFGLTSNPLDEMNQTHPRDAGYTLGWHVGPGHLECWLFPEKEKNKNASGCWRKKKIGKIVPLEEDETIP